MLHRPAPGQVTIPELVMEATNIIGAHPYKVTAEQATAACEEGTISQAQYDALYDYIEARRAN